MTWGCLGIVLRSRGRPLFYLLLIADIIAFLIKTCQVESSFNSTLVQLKVTDLLFDEYDKVVITEMTFPETPGVEDEQEVTIECTTDKPFELTLD